MAIVHGSDFGVKICHALGLVEKDVARIIIDIPANGPVKAYVEMYVTDRFLKMVDLSTFKGIEIEIL